MKGRSPYLLVGALAVVFVLVLLFQPQPLDWRPNYEADSATPLGAEIFYALLPEWAGAPVELVPDPPFLHLEDTTATNTLYFFLTSRFHPDDVEAERLYRFAERGNTVFVAAEHVAGLFADTLGLPEAAAEALGLAPGLYTLVQRYESDSTLVLVNPAVRRDGGYAFPHDVGLWVLEGLDPARTTVLGLSADSLVTLVRIEVGEGAVVLSTTPYAFANVMLAREGEAADYLGAVLAYLPAERIWWDAYHKPTPRLARTPMRVVLASPSLRWAYGLLVFGAALFLVFRGRRWQRPVPVVEPPPNTQREFVRTIGRLYAEHDDRHALVERMLRSFFDRLRKPHDVKRWRLAQAIEHSSNTSRIAAE